MIAAPLAMLVAIRPLLARARPAAAAAAAAAAGRRSPSSSSAASLYSSFLALRDAPVGPPGHGSELQRLPADRQRRARPLRRPGPLRRLRAARRRHPRADRRVPRRARLPEPREAFRHRRRLQPDRLRLLLALDPQHVPLRDHGSRRLEQRGARCLPAIARTPSYVLWEKRRDPPRDRHVLLEGTEAGRRSPTAPRRRSAILTSNPGRASLFPDVVDRRRNATGTRAACSGTGEQRHTDARPAGRALAALAPVLLALRPDPERAGLPRSRSCAALDGQRPNTISLANNGQFWPAGELESDGGPVEFTISAAEPSAIQSFTGYDGKAAIGELVAVRDRAAPDRRPRRSVRRLARLVRVRRRALGGAAQSGLGGEALRRARGRRRRSAPVFSSSVDDDRRDVHLPAAEAVDGRGREGVVVVVPGLAEGRASRSAPGCATRRWSRSRACRRRGRAS